MPRLASRQPRYCLHSQSGQACVYIDGKRHMLGGAYNSPQTRAEYDRLIAEWLGNQRRLPAPPIAPPAAPPVDTTKVEELIEKFWTFAQGYHQAKELANYRIVLRHLNRVCGKMPIASFGPNALRDWRDGMIAAGTYKHPATGETIAKEDWSRSYCNKQLARVKAVFKWGTSRQLVPPGVYEALRTVESLTRGRCKARETEPVKPVPPGVVEAILEHCSAPIRALVELESITGARGGELLIMRRCDLDTAGKVWIFKPTAHKGQWRGHSREIPLGPRCQEIVKPFLELRPLNPQAYLFSPADAEAARRTSKPRKTPIEQGNRPGTNCSDAPKWTPADRYTPDSYRRAIEYACAAAFPLPADIARGRIKTGEVRTRRETQAEWHKRIGPAGMARVAAWRKAHRFHPHQLRHTAATTIRREFGLEAAAVILGHHTIDATQIYAEANRGQAIDIMAKIG